MMQNYFYALSGNVFQDLRQAPVFQQGLVIAVLSLISVFTVLFTFYLAVRFLGNIKEPNKTASANATDTPAAPVQAIETPESPPSGYEEVSAEEHELLSVIASSIAAGDKPDSAFQVKSIRRISEDEDKNK